MKKARIQNISALIYENKMSNMLGIMADKSQRGLSIEKEIKEITEKISVTEGEIKEFLKKCFTEFKNLK